MMNVQWPRFGAIAVVVLLARSGWADAPAPAAAAQGTPHLFKYTPPPGSPTVSVTVAGDFDGWSPTEYPMSRANDGTYAVSVTLPGGLHHYKFDYDGTWIADPQADKSLEVNNGFGDVLSGISVPNPGAVAHTFRYVPPAGASTVPVSVAGDFNGWSADPNPLVRNSDGSYSGTVQITPGLHHYKIVYGGKWLPDPAADTSLENDDGFGGKNSGVNVVAEAGSAHTFRYVPPAGSPTVPVSVAGDFNQWNAAVNPMTRAADGSYSASVEIPPGLHHYKIVADGKWIPDPTADKSLETDDGFGGKNSGITIEDGPRDTAKPAG